MSAHHDQHSDPLALADYGGDASRRLTPRSGTNLAYVENEVRASRSVGASTWSLLARQSATLVASPGALALAADAGSAGRPAQSQRWDVDGRYLAFAGAGIEWQHQWAMAQRWTLALGAQGLALRHLRERRIVGAAGFDAATQAYDFDLQSFEANDRLDFPFQQPFTSRGWGLLFSGQLSWQEGPFAARLAWRDAGWLRWSELPEQQARLATATQAYDADGFVIYRPLVQGVNSQPGRTRRAALRTTLAVDWQPDAQTRLELRADGLQGYGLLPAVAVQRAYGDLQIGLTWRTHERRASLGLGWRGLQLELGADRLGAGARSRQLALSYRWAA